MLPFEVSLILKNEGTIDRWAISKNIIGVKGFLQIISDLSMYSVRSWKYEKIM